MKKSSLAFLCILFLFSCEKTDQTASKDIWVLKATNESSFKLKMEFINDDILAQNRKTFLINSLETIELFRGSSGLLADDITRMYYDTCKLVFENKYLLLFIQHDTFQHNILRIENFTPTGEYQDGMKVLMYTITKEDFLMADSL